MFRESGLYRYRAFNFAKCYFIRSAIALRRIKFVHRSAWSTWRATQRFDRSWSNSSFRALSSRAAPKNSLVEITIQISGGSIDGSIEDSPVSLIVDGWCSVLHHSTEKLIIGMLTAPARISTEAIRAPLRRSSNAA